MKVFVILFLGAVLLSSSVEVGAFYEDIISDVLSQLGFTLTGDSEEDQTIQGEGCWFMINSV